MVLIKNTQNKKNIKNIPKSKILFELIYDAITMLINISIGIANIVNQKEINSIKLCFSSFWGI